MQILLLFIFFILFVINETKLNKSDRLYVGMLEYINSNKDNISKNNIFENKDFLKMYDKGIYLSEDIGQIEFNAIGTKKDYYM